MTTADEAVARARTGARIRELRTARGLVARQVAEAAGCSESHILNIEAGRSRATYGLRVAIAEVLGVSAADLGVAS